MLKLIKYILPFFTATVFAATPISECKFKDIQLNGKVKIVTYNADIKVKVVEHAADIDVKVVTYNPDDCGEWQFVTYDEDFTIQFVEHSEDITIHFVTFRSKTLIVEILEK